LGLYIFTINIENFSADLIFLLQFKAGFQHPGLYNLTVEAGNYVSRSSVTIPVRVLHPVVMVTVSSRPIPLGEPSIINITVTGGQNVSMQVDFGDGTLTEIFTINSTHKIVWLSWSNNLPDYRVRIIHQYLDTGTYQIKVNVSNIISSKAAFGRVIVGEPITGITLHSDSPRIIDISETVIVMATVETGDDLEFKWDFSDFYSPQVFRYGI